MERKLLHKEDISLENLLKALDEQGIDYDKDLITKTYNFTKSAHKGQLRKSGEEYFIHPVNVAFILISLKMDQATIMAGMMHDILEDTPVTHEEMAEEFGEEVAYLAEGVTKLTNMPFKSKLEYQAENFRKMMMAMSQDIRVIIIKLADRLHNMRTLEYMTKAKQYEKATETLEIYAPLASRLGISRIKWELEDLSFLFLDPDHYYEISKKIDMRRDERESYLNKIMSLLSDELEDMGIEARLTGRPKHIYSVYNKMKKQGKTFEEIYDLLGIRVIVDTVSNCYRVLGLAHQLWKPIPGRFKDYIAMPKANMYQSIHSTVIGPEGKVFEVQIRTEAMHRTAEYGVAAHWKYKEGSTSKADNFENGYRWLRMMRETQEELKDPKEFMTALKEDFFSDEVYVFSPKGDVIGLPAGSIPIDFAYRVHTAVGNNCVGAKINGKLVPLDTELKNGDIVEIITSSSSSGPSKDWIDMVKSSSARQKIRRYFKKTHRDENIIKGRDMVEKEVRRQGFAFSEILKEDWIKEIAKKMSFDDPDDMYAALGYGSISTTQIIPKLKEKYKDYYKPDLDIDQINDQARKKKKANSVNGLIFDGVDNIKVSIAKCCNPVPGDEIIGYITRGRGVTVHRTDCPNMENVDLNRTIDVRWDRESTANYNLHLNILAYDRVAYVANLSEVVGDMDINIDNITAKKNTSNNTFTVDLILDVNGSYEPEDVLRKLSQIDGTIKAYRVK